MTKPPSALRLVLTSGFAMFSMFFGSGNLVYPILAGENTLGSYPFTILGFFLTAVCVPFLGLLGVILYDGNRHYFFGGMGKLLAFLTTAFMLALMGPFAVIPRCITVAYGGISVLTKTIPQFAFAALFCCVIALAVYKRSRVVDVIAYLLTPFKFGSIVLLIILGVLTGVLPDSSSLLPTEAFRIGLFEGYQTMDLMGALFFASTIYEYISRHVPETPHQGRHRRLFHLALWSSVVGGLLLGLVYIGFVVLGASYANHIVDVRPESMLVVIAHHAIGQLGGPLVAFMLMVSCLATATVLTSLFTDFLHEDIMKKKVNRLWAILATLVVSFAISLLGFQSIRVFLGTTLGFVYPVLLIYTLWQIGRKLFKRDLAV